jgi:hypothetical protein
MKDIENQLDRLAEKLPEGYVVELCVEKDSAWLQVMTPQLERIPIEGDHETCWAMLMADALNFALIHLEENVE